MEEYVPQKATSGPSPTPAFEDLRGIEFSTGSPLPPLLDPQPTTYRAPIDFDLGTTAATGIDVVGDVVILKAEDQYDESLANGLDNVYPDEYETEDETDYEPDSENIPIIVEETQQPAAQEEEALASYDPVVLLVGTPEKVRTVSSLSSHLSSQIVFQSQQEAIPLFESDLDPRVPAKRKAQGASKLKTLYNNW